MALLTARAPRRGHRLRALAIVAALVAALAHASVRDYQVEAVFLFNFTQFVAWPSAAFDGEAAPIVIGVLGDDPFDGYLEATVRGETVAARSLAVRRYRSADEIGPCHVLFISRSEAGRIEQVVARLKSRNVLTVSDADGFIERGGMIRFVLESGHVKLRINIDAVRAAGLEPSSKLLRVAEITTAEKG